MSIIAIDFDRTYTDDPELWDSIIQLAISRGHQVYIVTMRMEYEEDIIEEKLDNVPIIYTNHFAKKKYVEEVHGLNIDIWCDDNPAKIFNDYNPK